MTDDPELTPVPATDSLTPKKGLRITLLKLLAAFAIIGVSVAFMFPAVRTARPAARRSQCKNNLKQIGLALENYHETYNALPPAYTVDANGKRLHSWRTMILPYIDQAPLYSKIDLSKAWDDPANAEAYKAAQHTYQCPSVDCPSNFTTYMVIVTPNSCFPLDKSKPFSEINDGRSNTVMVIEVDPEHAVHWMDPTDASENLVLGFEPKTKLAHPGGMHALLADGSVRFLGATLSAAQRRALISIAGNDPVGEF